MECSLLISTRYHTSTSFTESHIYWVPGFRTPFSDLELRFRRSTGGVVMSGLNSTISSISVRFFYRNLETRSKVPVPTVVRVSMELGELLSEKKDGRHHSSITTFLQARDLDTYIMDWTVFS